MGNGNTESPDSGITVSSGNLKPKSMNGNILRTGIVGSGFAAQFHYEAVRRVCCCRIEVAGAYSRNPDKLHSFTSGKGIRAFDNLDDLIQSSDVVHVCTPPSTHEEILIRVLQQGKQVIVEKPFTGYFGDGTPSFNGDLFPKKQGLTAIRESLKRILAAEKESAGSIMYAENWIYAPAIQKEKEVIEKTGAQLLWIQAQQSHSGSHSMDYGQWRLSGGGSLMGKGAHPLTTALYLKRVEGLARNGSVIRPKSVSARTHAITRHAGYRNEGHLRDTYTDTEDYAFVHILFEDGTFADITASELLQGGVKNYLEVHANNHRTICNIAPNNAMQLFNPAEENLKDVYVVEKTSTRQGWSFVSPDESWFNGYQHEMDAFYGAVNAGSGMECGSMLAADAMITLYTAYLSAEMNGVEVPVLLL
jgi:predicted dehydrogenase